MAEPAPLQETPDRYGAYLRLSDAQIEALAGRGERRRTQPAQVLCLEGEASCDIFVILEGKLAATLSWHGR